MKLTGKTKEEFEKWLFKYYYEPERKSQVTAKLNVVSFKNRDIATQIGVLILYFDSVGIIIEIQVHTEPTMQGAKFKKFRPEILANRRFNNVGASFGKRERAWTQAVEKALEIREEQLK